MGSKVLGASQNGLSVAKGTPPFVVMAAGCDCAMAISPWNATCCVLVMDLSPILWHGGKQTVRVTGHACLVQIVTSSPLVENSWCRLGPFGQADGTTPMHTRQGGKAAAMGG